MLATFHLLLRLKRKPFGVAVVRAFAALSFMGMLTFPVLAAPLSPDEHAAQELLRQQEQDRALRQQLERHPDVRLGAGEERAPALPESESPCFTISEIRLDDPSGQLGWAIAATDLPGDPATGRCLGSRGINLVMTRIQNALVERGYVTTRVLAEAQDLTTGVLTLKLIPGRIRAIRFSEDSDSRANAWNAIPAAPGDLLNLRDIEQALENWKRVPTAEADIRIVPGDEPGESDLVVTWKQAFPLRLTLSINDGGSKTTGKYQGSATLSADHLLTLNDLFYASYNKDLGGGQSGRRGTRGYTMHYSLPFAYWTVSATRSTHRYHQSVAGAYQNYLYRGTSENNEIQLSRLVFRDAVNKTTVSLRGYLTQSRNFIDDTEIEVQRRRMAGWAASIGHRAFRAGAVLDLELSWRRGTGAFAALEAPEDAFGEGTARPKIVNAEASLSLPFRLIGQSLRYNGLLRAQWNRTPLVPQDRFSIGGRYTVRGFDGESILMAERGFLIRNDVSLPFGDGRQEIYAGLDYGRVGGPSTDLLVGRALTGAVIGWRGTWKTLSWDVFTGAPVKKPDGFATDPITAGFNLTLSL
ncbi:MAG: ShlB/FhaC/HecB family hemolysin secretion/activation protein [Zoogloeaceae bacterium]|jgi:hemolysin activation/secretion protein|nr:ShlB/FhaC/HecB family hemolysin secretion/activation protein [Zoogloeaceae bacterium]